MVNLLHESLARRFPSREMVAFEIAALKAQLEMPKGVVHVISDIHGEAAKLRHVINNASGMLRPVVVELFNGEMNKEELGEFLQLLYYPTELLRMKDDGFQNDDERYDWVLSTLTRQFVVIRHLIRTRRRKEMKEYAPKEFRELFEVLLNFPAGGHDDAFLYVQLRELVARGMDFTALRAASRFIRNVAVEELIVAGDLGDRGARLDWVVDYLMKQSDVGLRVSLRYRRMFQLEEGYGILTKALEQLAEQVYGDDPAEYFLPKRGGERDEVLIARMQKAISVIQFKLEGQMVQRHPEWDMEDRNVMERINYQAGTIDIDGKTYPLRDTHLPTVDPDSPNELSPEERHCMDRLVESFTSSSRLWEHMNWVAQCGKMAIVRDRAVIFHACLAVDEDGEYESLNVDGKECKGVAQFDAFNRVIKRAFRQGSRADQGDKDWFYYLWAGARSPLFGKDKMATFETYFVADKATHVEKRNPWFEKLHDAEFCDRVCREMGVEQGGLIVNGHVPVKVEKGEEPVKRGGNAVTIDGAFSEAYGDKGFTLILSPHGDYLAEHHGFRDPVSVVRSGEDIVPTMREVRTFKTPRSVKHTAYGRGLEKQIEALEELLDAYASGAVNERS